MGLKNWMLCIWNAKLLKRLDAERISKDFLVEFAGQTCWETGVREQVCKVGWVATTKIPLTDLLSPTTSP